MNKVENIGTGRFPKQGSYAGMKVSVKFDMGEPAEALGTVVRDDAEMPHVGIIRLDDGRHILMTECYYVLAPEGTADENNDTKTKEQ